MSFPSTRISSQFAGCLRPLGSFLVVLIYVGCEPSFVEEQPWSLDELEVEVADTSREVSFTNKNSGFFYSESNAPHRNGWQGWHIKSTKILADFRLSVDGKLLDRSDVDYARVWPDRLTRSYHNGVQETVTLLDSVDAMVITLEQIRGTEAGMSVILENDSAESMAIGGPSRQGIFFSVFPTGSQAGLTGVPGWVGVGADRATVALPDTILDAGAKNSRGLLRATIEGTSATFFVVAGPSPKTVSALIEDLRVRAPELVTSRRNRMEALLASSYFRSSDRRFDRALAWAKLSMDALIMRQGRKGIFAGLPWFSNYWGRDTFISLPGATLVTGRYEEAREILQSFASWQNTDPDSPDEGRIPNIVTPTSTAYNTADATPWFALSVLDYLNYSGDVAFVRSLFPVLRRAIEGPMRHRVDENGFLTHGEAETWMDAVGPEGPWSPRGNRANDIQALWGKQLAASTSIAEALGERRFSERWAAYTDRVIASFQQEFINEEGTVLYDHINTDGTADSSFRPNQLFALGVVSDPTVRRRVFASVTERLVYPYGVGSLDPNDANFHPFHHHAPFYVQDAAYHNGIVWTWLNGEWMRIAVSYGRHELAFSVAEEMVHQILDRGGVGTISELLDAAPRPGRAESDLSGTFSQAWSLASFIQTVYQAFLGVSVNAPQNQVWLLPRLPGKLESVTFDIRVADGIVRVSMSGDGTRGRMRLRSMSEAGALSFNVGWPLEVGRGRSASFELVPGASVEVDLTEEAGSAVRSDGAQVSLDTRVQFLAEFPELHSLQLAPPTIRANLRSLRGPEYPLLSHAVVSTEPSDLTVVVDGNDPPNDDRGPGTFVYPRTPYLRKGSLDIRRATISKDDSVLQIRLRFETLSNPGWHPEYGYQLTFSAIAIDTDGRAESGATRIGRNSLSLMPDGRGYEYVIYVGGGVRVEDKGGRVVAAYLPAPGDEAAPIGNVEEGSVSFSLPLWLFDGPSLERVGSWRYSIYVGAQDDHGGTGLGDFRSVEREAGEWVGGGRKSRTDPNVYDRMEVP